MKHLRVSRTNQPSSEHTPSTSGILQRLVSDLDNEQKQESHLPTLPKSGFDFDLTQLPSRSSLPPSVKGTDNQDQGQPIQRQSNPPIHRKPLFPGLSDQQTVQPSLTIRPAGDKYEQQADQVAARVVKQINTPQTEAIAQRDNNQDNHSVKPLQLKPMVQGMATEGNGEVSHQLESSWYFWYKP